MRFTTSTSGANLTSLEGYVSRMKKDQKDILYISGAPTATAPPRSQLRTV